MAEKQLVRVLEELGNGPAHCHDIADEIGITPKTASALLSELLKAGMVRIVGQSKVKGFGSPCRVYERVG